MLIDFSNVLVFALVGTGFVLASLMASRILRPTAPFREKLMTYECGEIPTEAGRINFNIRFYVFALVFIIFDVEIALMFPVGVVFREWVEKGNGLVALVELLLFVLILVLGLVYVWLKGDMEWVRKLVAEPSDQGTQVVPKASRL